MKIKTLVVGQLQTNCYLAICLQTQKAVIIDPGDEASFISETIINLKIKPVAIIATHGHFDHILAAWELEKNFNLPFFIHKKDEFLLRKMSSSASYWLGRKVAAIPPTATKFIKKGGKINFGKQALTVLETPGHTPGGISLYSKKQNVLFSGDTLFKNGIGRTDFSYASFDDLQKSLKRLLKLPGKTVVCPGHGAKTKIKEEIINHPYFVDRDGFEPSTPTL